MSDHAKDAKKGFTLIELLIVIGVLGILAGIILVAVDPAKRLQQARDARRFSEVNAVLNAILNYTVDNKGTLPNSANFLVSATGTRQQLGTSTGSNCRTATCLDAADPLSLQDECLDLTTDLVDEYIAEIPVDPEGANDVDTFSAVQTGYYVSRSSNGRVEVGACNAEIETTIKIKR